MTQMMPWLWLLSCPAVWTIREGGLEGWKQNRGMLGAPDLRLSFGAQTIHQPGSIPMGGHTLIFADLEKRPLMPPSEYPQNG